MNYIMKMIASSFPASVNLLKNLAQSIENEFRNIYNPNKLDGSLDIHMKRLEIAGDGSSG